MMRREVEEIVAYARALIEAHERRHPEAVYATENEEIACNRLAHVMTQAFQAEAEQRRAA